MNKLFLTIVFSILLQQVVAQVKYKCGTDYYDSIEVANDPTLLKKRMELEEFTRNFIKKGVKGGDTIVIPMVFHVLHQYGEERISIEKIENGIKQINKDYNAQNTEINNVVSDFQSIIGDANYEFRLAKIDPDGNCTSGVVYYDTELTYKASNSLKYTIHNWDPTSYLNIWTVSSISSGAAAWSHYPGIISTLDGVVSIYTYVTGHTLSHEIGHYLNLAHPWGSTNEPGLPDNCNIDDEVDDTPLTIGVDQHCNLNQVSCGSLDNVQNFMDYSTCEAMFTLGQFERTDAALNSAIGGRKYLWTDENLVETGTNDGYEPQVCKPVADFVNNVPGTCQGDTIQFTDYSYNGEPTNWEWTFQGGSPASSTDKNPFVAYNTPGLYSVSLTASNSAGESQIVRENLIFVTDTLKGIIAPALVDMEDDGFPDYGLNIFKKWSFENGGSYNWEVHNDGNTSMRINNFGNSDGTINSMITSNIDLSGIENPNYIYFDYAYAQRFSASDDELKVYVSGDCGKKWAIKVINKGKSMVTSNSEYVTGEFIPDYNEWKQERISISHYKNNNYLQIKFQMESEKGNYFYIDNINIGKPLSVESANRSINGLKIYPNPAYNQVKIQYGLNKPQKVNIHITNILGKTIYKNEVYGKAGENTQNVNLKSLNLSKGIYLVSVFNSNIKYSKNLIIIE